MILLLLFYINMYQKCIQHANITWGNVLIVRLKQIVESTNLFFLYQEI